MKRKSKLVLIFAMICMLAAILTGCIPGDGSYGASHRAGFLWGIWHGWLAPVSLIASLFNHNIRIYETFNTGWWYDFGFYIAVISQFGGLSLSRKKKDS